MNYEDFKPVDSCQISALREIIVGVFGLKSDGLFVEVGAYDCISYSNTYQLANIGWKGIYIEPMPHLYKACVELHKDNPNITVVNYFVDAQDSNITADLYECDGSYSSNINYIEKLGGVYRHSIMRRTLTTILDELNIDKNSIDILVVDTEGYDFEVLEGLHSDPKMVIIETHEYSDKDWMKSNTCNINHVMNRNYIKIYTDKINSIYVRRTMHNCIIEELDNG